jgi:dihydroorotate dehydrogenase
MQECFEVADYLAVNISSPNTEGLRKLSSKEFLEDLICEINKEKFKLERIYSKQVPILFKLSPDESDENLKSIIDLSLSNGISGFILTNTLKADHFGMKGGISGELLKERSNLVLKKVKKIVSEECILISSGGISTKSDAEERISNGANLLQIYTSFVYKGPEIIEELLN